MASLLCGLMCYQVTWCWEALVTLYALKWLFSRVGPLIFLQVASYSEPLVTLWAFERLLSCVGPLILLQRTWLWEALVTLCLLEWHLSSVCPIMFPQVASNWEALVALWAFKRLFSCVGPPCAERWPCHTFCTLMAILPCGFPHIMYLQVASYWEAWVTLGIRKRGNMIREHHTKRN